MSRSAARDGRAEVVVSGLGVVSPYGAGVKSFWNGLWPPAPARSSPSPSSRPRAFARASPPRSPPRSSSALGSSRRRSRADRIALAAAREALADAGLEGRERAGGRACSSARSAAACSRARTGTGPDAGRGRPSSRMGALRSILPFSHAETLGWRLGLTGPKETVVMACASGAASIALGADLVRAGVTPTALVGGVDALTHICFMGFNALKLLDPSPCRPFDRDRRGMSHRRGGRVPRHRGRGALPGARRPRARAARRLRHDHRRASRHRAASRGRGDDPRDAPGPGRRAGSPPATSATSTLTAPAPRRTIASRRSPSATSSARAACWSAPPSRWSATPWPAAGSVEAAATILALQHGLVPPTANLERGGSRGPFDCLPRMARPARISAALSNSFGFGGQNVSLIFARDGS